MICIHHIDDDGLCAAAIVRNTLSSPFQETEFIPYNHGDNLLLPRELYNGEIVYIVDLALNDQILNVIKTCVNHNCIVIHIDHHISGINYYNKLSDDDKNIYDQCIVYHDSRFSATLLTWTYSCMSEVDRSNPRKSKYEYTENFSHVRFDVDGNDNIIPLAVRLIDDYDVWRFILPETKAFHMGFQLTEDKSPSSDIWQTILFDYNGEYTAKIIQNGQLLLKYQSMQDKSLCKTGFEACIEIDGKLYYTFAINSVKGNSWMFGDKINAYGFVTRYGYDGNRKLWTYSFYSTGDDGTDVSVIAEKFGGGGHKNAAGCTLPYNLFDTRPKTDDPIPNNHDVIKEKKKVSIWTKIFNFFFTPLKDDE